MGDPIQPITEGKNGGRTTEEYSYPEKPKEKKGDKRGSKEQEWRKGHLD